MQLGQASDAIYTLSCWSVAIVLGRPCIKWGVTLALVAQQANGTRCLGVFKMGFGNS